jgi:hypothetical protein
MVLDALREAQKFAPADLAIRTASPLHHASAHHLVARRYAWRGYATTQLSTYSEDALTICSAFQGERTVGTIAVRFASEQGLNADVVFAEELASLRASDLSICEFGRLAVDEDASDNKQVLAKLFHLAYLHAHRLAGCELLVIEVNPRHVAFYRRMLGFRVLSEVRLNPRVNAPAVLLSLDLREACQQIACFGGKAELASQTRTLYPYFYGADEEAAMLAKLRQ